MPNPPVAEQQDDPKKPKPAPKNEYAQMLASLDAPAAPAAPVDPSTAPNDYRELLGVKRSPFADVISRDQPSADITATIGAFQNSGMPFAVRHPIIHKALVEPVVDFSRFVFDALASGAAGRMPSPVYQAEVAQEVQAYFDAQTPERRASGMRGFALAASFVPGAVATRLASPLITRIALTGKTAVTTRAALRAAAFMAGESLGGTLYGALTPVEPGLRQMLGFEGEPTRAGQIIEQTALFGATGGLFYGVGAGARWVARGYRKYVHALPRAARIAAIRDIQESLETVENALTTAGTSIDGLPPELRDDLMATVYQNAVPDADPVKLEGFIRNEIEGAAEAQASTPGTASILPDADRPFEFAKPLEPPEGFVPGAQRGDEIAGIEFTIPQSKEWMSGRAVVHRNVRPGEDPWRVTILQQGHAVGGMFFRDADGPLTPLGHQAFPTLESAREFARKSGFVEERLRTVKDLNVPVTGRPPKSSIDREILELLEPTAAPKPKYTPRPRAPKDFEPTTTSRRGEPASAESDAVAKRKTELLEAAGRREVDESAPPPEAFADVAIENAVAEIPLKSVSTPEVRAEAVSAKQPPIVPPERVDPIETIRAEQPDGPLSEAGLDDLDIAARMQDGEIEALQREFMRIANRDPQPPASELDLLKRDMQKIGSAEAEFAEGFVRKQKAAEAAKPPSTPLPPDVTVYGGLPFDPALLKSIPVGRLLTGLTGASMMVSAKTIDDDEGSNNVMWAIGGMLIAAAGAKTVINQMQRTQPYKRAIFEYLRKRERNLLLNAAPQFLFKNAGAKEGARRLTELWTWARELAHNERQTLIRIFPEDSWRNAQIAVDEMDLVANAFPAEFHALTPLEQQYAKATNQLNLRLRQLLKSENIEDEYIEGYARRLLPRETYDKWLQQGYRQVIGPTGPRRVRYSTLREMESFAAAHGLPAPIIRFPDIQALRMTEAYRAIGNARLRKMLKGLRLIEDAPTLANQAFPDGWVVVKGVPSLRGKMAPEAVAKALENLSSPIASKSDILNGLDTVKTWWMKSIMFWFWEHGLNAMRAVPLLSTNPEFLIGMGVSGASQLSDDPKVRRIGGLAGAAISGHSVYRQLRDPWKAIRDMDPGVIEAARWGLNLRARTDYGLQSAKKFEELLQRVGRVPLIGSLMRSGARLQEKQERLLWDRIIPTLQYFSYQTEMKKWAQRTGHKLLPGSNEYIAAARKAADFANVVAGRIPMDLANPQLLQLMRLAMFSPQWTSSRIALAMGAAGELGEVVSGRLNPMNGTYLPAKLRQVAFFVALTWLGSKMLSGKEPEFNPRTTKFYMRTGLRNATGREVGLDMLGWWQDELKLFNDPVDFTLGRLNPVLKIAQETITGRDFAGRDMTGPQTIANIAQSFGPPTEAIELGLRAVHGLAGGAQGMSGGELLSRTSGVTATFNVAALPRPIDAAISKVAKRLLDAQHLPRNDYLVFELSRLLRGNLQSGQGLIDDRVITYLAYRRRTHAVHEPLGYSGSWLWSHGRKILGDF